MKYPKIDELLGGWRDEIVDAVGRWISIPSVKAPPEGDMPFGRHMAGMLDTALSDTRRMGIEARNVDNFAGDVTLPGGERVMGVLVHLDVVPEGDGWTRPPYGGVIEGSRIYGRGASDNKGPAVAALYALRAVKEAGIPLKDSVRLIFGCDEESGWEDIAHYQTKVNMPDYGFSPDAGFPVYHAEKGIIHPLLTATNPDARLISLTGGTVANVVPPSAVAVVRIEPGAARAAIEPLKTSGLKLSIMENGDGTITLEALGKPAHGAGPENGVNAAGMLLLALNAMGIGGTPVSFLAERIGMAYDGEGLGIKCQDEPSGVLTMNLGTLKLIDGALCAQLDIRYPVTVQRDWVFNTIAATVSGPGFDTSVRNEKAPLYFPKDHPLIVSLLKVYEEVTGNEGYVMSMGGGTYARALPCGVAFGAGFPDSDPECGHQSDEFTDIDNLMLAARVIAHAIADLAGA